jgi:hypothetical protein
MINEDAPTNSVGTGAETALPPSHEPPGITRLTRAKVKKRRYEKSVSDMLKTEELQEHAPANYLPFRVQYEDSQDFILYGKSEAQVKIELRKMYRPEMAKKFKVKRLYPAQVIKFYWDKRQQAMSAQ